MTFFNEDILCSCFSDVTAVGGESIKEHDYVSIDHSIIEFKNQEKSKNIDIKINKEAKVLIIV